MRSIELRRKQLQMLMSAFSIIVMWILGKQLNNIGIFLLVLAIETSTFFVIVCSEHLSEALGRFLRSKQSKRQYKNVSFIRWNVGIIQGITGAAVSLLFCVLSGVLSSGLFRMEYLYYPLLLITPLIFLRILVHVFLGYFQGIGNELPTIVVSILRQLLLLGTGISFGNSYMEKGLQISELLKQDIYRYMYGVMGVIIAMVLTELVMLVLLISFFMFYCVRTVGNHKDGLKSVDSRQNILRFVYRNRLGAIVLRILYSAPLWVALVAGCVCIDRQVVTLNDFALFWVKTIGLIGILLFVIYIFVLPLQNSAVSVIKTEGPRYASEAFNRSVLYLTAFGLFVAVSLVFLREQISMLLDKNNYAILSGYLIKGAFIVVFAVLSELFAGILSLLGKKLILMVIWAVVDIFFAVIMFISAAKGFLSIDGILMGLLLVSLILCIVSGLFTGIVCRTGAELLFPFLACILSACVAGLVQMGLTALFAPHLGSVVTIVVVLLISLIPYLFGLLFLRIFKEYDFEYLPGGNILLAFAQMIRLY